MRAILEAKWIIENEIQFIAFYPRPIDTDGLSLSFDQKGAGCAFKKPIFGFLNVNLANIRNIPNGHGYLDVIQDKVDHALIQGIPNFHLMPKNTTDEKVARREVKKQAQMLAQQIAELAASEESYNPQGFHPSEVFAVSFVSFLPR